MTDLMEHVKERIRVVAEGFEHPTSDFYPMLWVMDNNGEMNIFQMSEFDMNDDASKDEAAIVMLAACACLRAEEAVFISSAWMVRHTNEEFARDDWVQPRDDPDRIEVVNVMHHTATGDTMATCEITRHEDRPPTLADEWSTTEGDVGALLGGRFGNAISKGFTVGAELAQGPPEIIGYMEQKIAAGELQDLMQSFIRGMKEATGR